MNAPGSEVGSEYDLSDSMKSPTVASAPAEQSAHQQSVRSIATNELSEEKTSVLEPLPEDEAAITSSEASLKTQMLGTWEDDYKGHRTLTLNADGTGTMVVELNGLSATLFASKLTFQEAWSVGDGKVTMKATGGEPATKVRLVLSLHGDSSTQRIVEVTDERMILVEEPSETRFEWRRVRVSDSRKETSQ